MSRVTSNNRTAAKRLLNNWHDSREVRVWTLQQLADNLQLAINTGLITSQGVDRALNKEPEVQTGTDTSTEGAVDSSESDDDVETNPLDNDTSGEDTFEYKLPRFL